MTKIPEENYSAVFAGDRPELPKVGDEREVLTSFLDWQRKTLEMKCSGIAPERLSDLGVPPSTMSLHGLIRHLTGAERWWFRLQFAGQDVPMIYYSDEDPEQDFDDLAGDVEEALARWKQECQLSRDIVAEADLDQTGTEIRTGKPVSLRVILVKMIAEYARHNGHADLLRERIDGAVGH
ncbi:DUF664 domain-containing protein [Fodinicola feengrottensis]